MKLGRPGVVRVIRCQRTWKAAAARCEMSFTALAESFYKLSPLQRILLNGREYHVGIDLGRGSDRGVIAK